MGDSIILVELAILNDVENTDIPKKDERGLTEPYINPF